jgi:hypothetical protein
VDARRHGRKSWPQWLLVVAIVGVTLLELLSDTIFGSAPWSRWATRALTGILVVLLVLLAVASWPLLWRLLP